MIPNWTSKSWTDANIISHAEKNVTENPGTAQNELNVLINEPETNIFHESGRTQCQHPKTANSEKTVWCRGKKGQLPCKNLTISGACWCKFCSSVPWLGAGGVGHRDSAECDRTILSRWQTAPSPGRPNPPEWERIRSTGHVETNTYSIYSKLKAL